MVTSGGTQTTRENLIQTILDAQFADGGWNLSGSTSDPDLTAMALQALAPYRSRSDVAAAVEEGVACLSEMQEDDGSYICYGDSNAESCAQVVTALAALDISPYDSRFVKNGISVLDALLSFANSDGSFCHTAGDGGNAMATDQALYALVACRRWVNGENRLYDMTDVYTGSSSSQDSSADSTESSSGETDGEADGTDDEEIAALLAEIGAISETPYLDEKSDIVSLSNRLEALGDFSGREEAEETPAAALAWLETLEEQVEALDEEIWNRIDPLRISQDDADTVEELWEQYTDLRSRDRTYVENRQDLKDARTVVKSLAKGVIPARVFTNLQTTGESFTYEGAAGEYAYTLTIEAADVTAAGDMKATVSRKNSDGVTLPDGAIGFRLKQTGSLAGTFTFTWEDYIPEGTYTLYHMDSTTGVWTSLEIVSTDRDGSLSFTTAQGGDFCLVPAAEETETSAGTGKATGSTKSGASSSNTSTKSSSGSSTVTRSNTRDAAAEDGVIPASEFEAVQGQEENLRYVCEAEASSLKDIDGEAIAYTLTFYGEDVESPADFDAAVSSDSPYAEEVGLLAEEAWLFAFAQDVFPGELLFSAAPGLADGDYLLCRYDPETGTAVYVKKVSVEDGAFQTVLAQGGTYFLAKEVLTASVEELREETGAESVTDEETGAEDVSAETDTAAETGAETDGKEASGLSWPAVLSLMVLAAACGLFAGTRIRR
ncbi:MAG: terpene cyclase/mutase family protein [Lachnospiraceae bacterium]|nr:terpene cyclase/mutase family protein [Lachnospiraceae bacterium]